MVPRSPSASQLLAEAVTLSRVWRSESPRFKASEPDVTLSPGSAAVVCAGRAVCSSIFCLVTILFLGELRGSGWGSRTTLHSGPTNRERTADAIPSGMRGGGTDRYPEDPATKSVDRSLLHRLHLTVVITLGQYSLVIKSTDSADMCSNPGSPSPAWMPRTRVFISLSLLAPPWLAYVACTVIWVLAFFLSSPSLVFRDTANQHGRITCFNNFSLSAASSSLQSAHVLSDHVGYTRHMAVTITRFLCGFLVPILIITACYLTIVCKLQRNRLAKTKKPFKIIVTIIITFFLCWCPYHTLYLLELYHTAMPGSIFSLGLPLATAIAIANSCMNPILYVFMGQDFKKFKVALFSRLVNALSEDTGHSSYPSHRSFTKMSSVNERCSMHERETSMV
ncbi:chemerin-like receptor 1 [Trichechus manatus latirostris]|uniref:Chemerin-like receptor 1 n=1 Tax=Trichechus manatus latirostris TaxID=127582 RepID=A0A2Y9R1H7_TRIMA|nr:chemerin-like receptor 1 [Trichechus manatus latirostris]